MQHHRSEAPEAGAEPQRQHDPADAVGGRLHDQVNLADGEAEAGRDDPPKLVMHHVELLPRLQEDEGEAGGEDRQRPARSRRFPFRATGSLLERRPRS
jgi:hypothetical protein